MRLLLFILLTSTNIALNAVGAEGCDSQLASCETPPAVPVLSNAGQSGSIVTPFSSSAEAMTFVDPVDFPQIPDPSEFDRYDADGMPVFIGPESSSVTPSNANALGGAYGFVTTTPPPYRTISLTWMNQATFNSSLALFAYVPSMNGLDVVRADGPFVRELRRRLTT